MDPETFYITAEQSESGWFGVVNQEGAANGLRFMTGPWSGRGLAVLKAREYVDCCLIAPSLPVGVLLAGNVTLASGRKS